MSLLGNLVGLANNLTQSFGLQADVVYHQYIGDVGGSGDRQYATAVLRKAIVTRKQKLVRKFDGTEGISNAQIVFLDPTEISEFDKIVMPVNGVVDVSADARAAAQPIIGTDAFVDGSNGPILTEIYLG